MYTQLGVKGCNKNKDKIIKKVECLVTVVICFICLFVYSNTEQMFDMALKSLSSFNLDMNTKCG